MNIFLFYFFVAVFCICSFFSVTRQYQMLQQNSYFTKRYLKWMSQSNLPCFIFNCVLGSFGIASVWVCDIWPLFSTVLLGLLAVVSAILALKSTRQNKKSIKPLVLTARVKRMWFAGSLIYILIAVVSVLFFAQTNFKIICSVLFGVLLVPQFLCLLSLWIMQPVEKAIGRHYINDAKRILRCSQNLKVIGVTGSYGKTSTKYILGRILSEKFNTVITPESFNTPMGIVRTVRTSIKPSTEIFVAEMGAKKTGDILEICKIANPSIGVITSVGPQHLDTFGSIENVAKTKFELADYVKNNYGKMFLNADNKIIESKSIGYDSVLYGTSENSNFKAENVSYNKDGLSLTVKSSDKEIKLSSSLLGKHNALNITAAVSVAVDLGLNEQEISYAVSQLKAPAHRLELKSYINNSTLIDDAYNSNPEGCLEAVNVLGAFSNMKKILVTPGLVELGDKEYDCNKALGLAAAKNCDIIILVGLNRSKPIHDGVIEGGFSSENLFVVKSFRDALALFSPMLDSNTVVLFENDLPDNYLY